MPFQLPLFFPGDHSIPLPGQPASKSSRNPKGVGIAFLTIGLQSLGEREVATATLGITLVHMVCHSLFSYLV